MFDSQLLRFGGAESGSSPLESVTCWNPQPSQDAEHYCGQNNVPPPAAMFYYSPSPAQSNLPAIDWIIRWRNDGLHHPVVECVNSHNEGSNITDPETKKKESRCADATLLLHLPDAFINESTNRWWCYTDTRTDGALQRWRAKERKKGEKRKMENKEEGLCLPRRACFILGLSMVTVAVLLPLTEPWLHPSVHTLLLPPTHTQHLSLLPHPVRPHPLAASLPMITLLHLDSDFIVSHAHKHLSAHFPLPFHSTPPTLSLCPTSPACCCSFHKALPTPSLSLCLLLHTPSISFSPSINMSHCVSFVFSPISWDFSTALLSWTFGYNLFCALRETSDQYVRINGHCSHH